MDRPADSAGPSRPRRVARMAFQGLVIALFTLALAEVSLRGILGIQPLTSEALVWQYHPRWGWAHRPGSRDLFVKPGCRQEIQINSRGLREREIPYEKPPGVFRVLVIGDSGVAGFEVASDAVFTRVAERWLRERGADVQFINAGHRGFGTDQSLLFLEDEGIRYRPDLVLYLWTENDREDNATIHRPFRAYGKGWFDLDDHGEPVLRGVPVPHFAYHRNLGVGEDGEMHELPVSAWLRAQMWIRDQTVTRSSSATALVLVAAALPQLRQALQAGSSATRVRGTRREVDRGSRLFRVTAALIAEMRRVARGNGAEFFILGNPRGWAGPLKETVGLDELAEYSAYRASIPEGARAQVPMDTHMNELGHRLYGEALARILLERGLVPSAAPPHAIEAQRALPGQQDSAAAGL